MGCYSKYESLLQITHHLVHFHFEMDVWDPHPRTPPSPWFSFNKGRVSNLILLSAWHNRKESLASINIHNFDNHVNCHFLLPNLLLMLLLLFARNVMLNLSEKIVNLQHLKSVICIKGYDKSHLHFIPNYIYIYIFCTLVTCLLLFNLIFHVSSEIVLYLLHYIQDVQLLALELLS